MEETWIRRACRKTAYYQLIVLFLLTAAVVAGFYASVTYWKNFFYGPYPMAAEDLAPIPDANRSDRQLITVTGTRVVSSGLQMITTETNNGVKGKSYVSSEYYLMVIQDNGLLVVESMGEPPLHVEGELKQIPVGLADKIFPSPADSDLKARIYPFMLSTTDSYRGAGYIFLAATAIYGVFLVFFGRRALRYAKDISLHPVVRRVESWPDAIEVAMMSERELQSAVRFKRSSLVITDNFVIFNGGLRFRLYPIRDLVWAYKKVTTNRVNFIPVSKTSTSVLVFYGGSVEFPGRQKKVEEVLTFSAERAPWAVLGYSEELAKAFKKNPAGMSAVVEERRSQLR
jgi:hypothetical protein